MDKREFLIKSGAGIATAMLLLSGCSVTPMGRPNEGAKPEAIEEKVDATLQRLYSTAPGSDELVRKASGVLVFPSVLAAGFVIGGEYGEGALRVHGKTVDYYKTVTGSLGLQIGAQSKAMVFFFMTPEALRKFQNSSGWTAGVDASVAIIRAGVNGKIDTNTVTQPVSVIVMTNEGLMANLNIEGTKITKLSEAPRSKK